MMNSYIKVELAALKRVVDSMLETMRSVEKELKALTEHREFLIDRMKRLEHEIERQEQYQTVMYIPDDLARVIRKEEE